MHQTATSLLIARTSCDWPLQDERSLGYKTPQVQSLAFYFLVAVHLSVTQYQSHRDPFLNGRL
jgi:hypothetical protein